MGSCTSTQTIVKETGEEAITPQRTALYLNYLASDSLKGRNTPSPGLDSAALFICGAFQKMGLSPISSDYLHYYGICQRNLGDSSRFSITRNGVLTGFSIKTDYIPFEQTGSRCADGHLVFAGYGITAQDVGYDDYAAIDAKGKIVVIFRHEPRELDSTSQLFKKNGQQAFSRVIDKIENAKAHGAAGLVILNEPANHKSMKPRGYPWPSLSKTLKKEVGPTHFCGDSTFTIPVVHGGEEVALSLFGTIDSLKRIQLLIDSLLVPRSFEFSNTTSTLQIDIQEIEKYRVPNLIAQLEGSDSILKNEFVVIGAHYDHVGFIDKHKADSDYIFNGADDNASGTSGVLSIAYAFSKMHPRPKRSVVFMLFSGEEKGLLGSKWYVEHPAVPLSHTVAMFNLDMIGRNAEDTLQLIGAIQNEDLYQVVCKWNKKIGFKLIPKRMSGGSDHWSFYSKGIPSLFFFSGLHKDYHQTSDNPDKINFRKVSRVSRLVFYSAFDVANCSKHFKVELDESNEYAY